MVIIGQTQGRSFIRIRNATTNAIVTGQADENGKFSIALPIGPGTNDIGISAIDPAGNQGSAVTSVRRGSGALKGVISASTYELRLKNLPERVELSVTVSDPDGRPLEGAKVTFSLAVPGVSAITSKTILSGGDGVARWSTTISKGAEVGQISAIVVVKTTRYGETTDLTVITLKK